MFLQLKRKLLNSFGFIWLIDTQVKKNDSTWINNICEIKIVLNRHKGFN